MPELCKLSQAVKAFYEFLVFINAACGKKQQHWNAYRQNAGKVIVSFAWYELIGFPEIEHDIDYGNEKGCQNDPKLELAIFVKKNINQQSTDNGDCKDQNDEVRTCGQKFKGFYMGIGPFIATEK